MATFLTGFVVAAGIAVAVVIVVGVFVLIAFGESMKH